MAERQNLLSPTQPDRSKLSVHKESIHHSDIGLPMDIRKDHFFIFSGEGPREGLPAECNFVRKLDNNEGRDVALVKCKHFIEGYGLQSLVLIPKKPEDKLFSEHKNESVIFLYILDGEKYKQENSIDLRIADKDMVDWGGVANNYGEVQKWCHWDECNSGLD